MEQRPQRLDEVLSAQIRCAEAMLAALEREEQALLAAEHAALDAARADKDRLTAELEALEQCRLALDASTGARSAATEERAEWQTLLALIGECRERNRRNGALLGARRESVAWALRSLRGTGPEPYGANGRESPAHGGRPLGSA